MSSRCLSASTLGTAWAYKAAGGFNDSPGTGPAHPRGDHQLDYDNGNDNDNDGGAQGRYLLDLIHLLVNGSLPATARQIDGIDAPIDISVAGVTATGPLNRTDSDGRHQP